MSLIGCIDRSPWLVHYNCNSCNGCDIEFVACLTPLYDVERFGVLHVGNPKHADILVVTGSVNHRNARVLRNVYDQMPAPKLVVALGACGATGGIFADCYNVVGGVEKILPVDVWIPGCPPRPEAIIDGVVAAVTKWREVVAAGGQAMTDAIAARRAAATANGEGPGGTGAVTSPEQLLAREARIAFRVGVSAGVGGAPRIELVRRAPPAPPAATPASIAPPAAEISSLPPADKVPAPANKPEAK